MKMKLYTSEMDLIIESKIKPNMKLIYSLKTQGYKDKYIAQALGISLKQFEESMTLYEELKNVYEDATMLLCAKLREVAIDRALGLDGKTDKDGIPVGPDANLAMRLLEKLDPAFKPKATDNTVTVTVEHIIHEISEKRRIEREKIRDIEEKHDGKEVYDA